MATKKSDETTTSVSNPYISRMEVNLASLTVTRDITGLSIGSSLIVPKGTVLTVESRAFNGASYPVCQYLDESTGTSLGIGTLLRRQCNDRWKASFLENKKSFIKDLSEHGLKVTLVSRQDYGTFTRPYYHVELVD